jgi:hypothetical protein
MSRRVLSGKKGSRWAEMSNGLGWRERTVYIGCCLIILFLIIAGHLEGEAPSKMWHFYVLLALGVWQTFKVGKTGWVLLFGSFLFYGVVVLFVGHGPWTERLGFAAIGLLPAVFLLSVSPFFRSSEK